MSQLIILTKYPTPGAVKTRLGASIGMEQAAGVQRKCIEKLIETHVQTHGRNNLRYETRVLLRQADKVDQFSDEFEVEKSCVGVQGGEELGVVIGDAFRQAFEEGHSEVIVIGSDTPLISAAHIQMLLSPLKEGGKQLTVGPVHDGGYYAIGANDRSIINVVNGMEYSHDAVCTHTLERANAAGFTTRQTILMRDCDTIDDLRWHLAHDETGRWHSMLDQVGCKQDW